MPDVRLPDGTIIKNVPEGTTRAQLAARLDAHGTKTGDGALVTFARGAMQGATFNFADEALAGIDAVTQPLFNHGSAAPTLGARYDENLKSQRDRFKADAEAHPIADIAGNIAGTIAGPGKLLNGAKGAIGLIKQGAAMGAIYGLGQGEGGPEERLKSAAEGAAIGGATGAALSGATKVFNKVRPANVGANYVNKRFDTSPMTKDSERIGKELGQTYTPGQATGSKSLLTIEGLVRRHPASADKMAKFDSEQMDKSLTNLVGNLDRLHANPSGPEATGNLVAKSFDDVVSKAVKVRRETASADFGRVDELAGRYRVIKPQNLMGAIDEIGKDFSAPGGGDASAALVKQIQGIKADLDRAGPQGLSAKETQRLLQIYGDAARGKGAIFKDLDTAQQRSIAGRLKDALIADVDDAADAGGHVGEIAAALKTARNNYKQNSAAINDLEKSVLGRLFGGDYEKSPERIAQAVKNMKPSELQQSMKILSSADPATSQAVKRYLVEDALNTAGVNPTSGAPQPQIAGETMFSAPKFLTAIRKSSVWGSFTPAERASMETAVRDLERISYRAGTDGSPTAPLLFAWEVAKAMGGGAAAMSPTQISKSVAAVLVPGKIAKAITTPEGQKALRTIRTAKPNSLAARAATSTLVGMLVGDDEAAPAAKQ